MGRIALESRSGIWLMFYERRYRPGEMYQQLLRIFGHRIHPKVRFEMAKLAALCEMTDRHIKSPLIVRDNSKRNVMIRQENDYGQVNERAS